MGKKKIEHVVFDGMRKIRNRVNIGKYNSQPLSNKKHREKNDGKSPKATD